MATLQVAMEIGAGNVPMEIPGRSHRKSLPGGGVWRGGMGEHIESPVGCPLIWGGRGRSRVKEASLERQEGLLFPQPPGEKLLEESWGTQKGRTKRGWQWRCPGKGCLSILCGLSCIWIYFNHSLQLLTDLILWFLAVSHVDCVVSFSQPHMAGITPVAGISSMTWVKRQYSHHDPQSSQRLEEPNSGFLSLP